VQLTTTTEVENFPGYPSGVTGTQMMDDLHQQATCFGTDIRDGLITKVELGDTIKRVWIDDKEIHADTVIISTGSSAKYLGLESESKYLKVGGVSACAICDGFFYSGLDVVIVGAGDSACEEALYLSNICKNVTMLVRSDDFRASKIMVDRVLRTQNITVEYNTTLDEILGSDTTVESVRLLNTKTDIIYDIKVDGVFIAIGHTPNTKIFEGQIELSSGYVVTDSISTKTNISGVFAAGDVADPIYRQAITSAGSGCKAAIDAEKYIGSLEII
jgi:thioredoxin reductase (NADPH)